MTSRDVPWLPPREHDLTQADLLPGEEVSFRDDDADLMGVKGGVGILLTNQRLIVVVQSHIGRTRVEVNGLGAQRGYPLHKVLRAWPKEGPQTFLERVSHDNFRSRRTYGALCVQVEGEILELFVGDAVEWASKINGAIPLA